MRTEYGERPSDVIMIGMAICADSECARTDIAGRGFCSLHYQRYRYRGVLDEIAPEPRRICTQCGKEFSPRRWGAIYCSVRCNNAARSIRRAEATGRRSDQCEQCGISLVDTDKRRRFCSERCSNNWRNAKTSERTRAAKVAEPRPCRGCGNLISPDLKITAFYCSEECKIRSRRHETYGLTKMELGKLLAQHDRCAICQTEDWGRKGPQVDHCHTTGRIRGILCANCNTGLGHFRDDPDLLRQAVEYLTRE